MTSKVARQTDTLRFVMAILATFEICHRLLAMTNGWAFQSSTRLRMLLSVMGRDESSKMC